MPSERDALLNKSGDVWKPTLELRIIQLVTWANVFLVGFDATIAAATYAIIGHPGSSFQDANNAVWISTSYLITSTSFQPLYGRLSDVDMFGRRKCFLFATTVFWLGSLLCGVAPNMLSLNLARAFTGIGGGGLQSVATIILSDYVPFQHRGKYQSANNLWNGLGAALGASLGAWITERFNWRFMFLVQLPVCTLGIIGGAIYIKEPNYVKGPLEEDVANKKQLKDIDILGSLTLVLGLSSLLAGLNLGGNDKQWSDPLVVGFLVSAAVFLIGFWIVELNAVAPILPPRLLRSTLAYSNITTNFFSGAACISFLFLTPLYFESVKQESSGTAGRRLIVPALGFPAGALVAGYVMSRYGYLNRLVQVGCVIATIGCALPLNFDSSGTNSDATYFWSLVPTNIGQGLINPSSLFTMLAAFSHAEQAVSTSVVYLFRNVGSVFGVTVTATIFQNYVMVYLPDALSGLENSDDIVDKVRKSVDAIHDVPIEYRLAVKSVLANGLKSAYGCSTLFAIFALVSSYWAYGGSLERKDSDETLSAQYVSQGEEELSQEITIPVCRA
ncbi:multidrug efflux transporter [Wallemia mellicola]|uniref:Multidrug efflux transporter n=2 Tax=Wallemia mellicola TaxID=1708541 RepID=A0A4T0MCE0_9BASI|nr:hypothetical protein E3Q24_03508 [Wallemia mellicola]TIB80743.1 multidrug efflux transporter [Wallemia mellicola]TIB84794.1 multidrug efflux transporter [Wallemia mellicola]TIC01929.1 multidrug efflux transporter [Wallemia mellicola]TIC14113.1 multidrug efflux transporter [Wallemia mellicola]